MNIGLNSEVLSTGRVQFNEGVLQANRIGMVQDNINKIRTNLLAFNLEFNAYNYQIWFNHLKSLVNENSKLTEQEKNELLLLQSVIKLRLLLHPPHKRVHKVNHKDSNVVFNMKNWLIVEELIEKFERYTRRGLDISGLSNPDIEGEGMF